MNHLKKVWISLELQWLKVKKSSSLRSTFAFVKGTINIISNMNCLGVFDHFVGLVLKGLMQKNN